jgi:four helix bundle suffix protein
LSDPSDASDRSDPSDKKKKNDLLSAEPEAAANIMICLVNQASYLLRKQLQFPERKFLAEGGFTERLYSQRQSRRGRS